MLKELGRNIFMQCKLNVFLANVAKMSVILLYTVSAQIEQRCSNFHPGFFGAVAFKFGKSAVIIKMLF